MKASDRRMTRFFLAEASKHRTAFLVALALILPVALLSAYAPKIFQLAIDDGIVAGNADAFAHHALIYLLLVTAGLLLEPMQQAILMGAGIRTLTEIRATVVHHIARLGRDVFERTPLGVFVSRATSDVEAIGETLASGLLGILTDVVRIAVVLAVLSLHDVRLGAIAFLLVPLVGGIINWFRVRMRSLYVEIRTRTATLSGILNEAVAMRREVLNFHLQEPTRARFDAQNDKLRAANIRSVSYDACTYSIIEGLSHVAVGVVLLLVAQAWVLDDVLTVGEVAMFILYLQQLFTPFKQLGQRFTVIQAAYAGLQKLGDTLALPLPADTGTDAATPGELAMEDVHFSYDGRRDVLQGISLRVPPGGSLAIVGPTGSGKTTIIRLLTRQYEPTRGTVRLGGVPLRRIARRALKRSVVLIPQEPALVRGTVWENIALGREEVDRARVEQACREIGADEILRALPRGYATELRSGADNISMGQRQLIALARAFVSDAGVLIFDESTANIDTATELAIQRALTLVMATRATIVIAHRLSTIRHVTHILVLKDGRIVEEGSHDALLAANGLYRRMVALQAFDTPEGPS